MTVAPAAVIQADTLTPSLAAAATTRSWTSESTVIASLGEGLPRGMAQQYYHSRRVVRTTGGGAPDEEPFQGFGHLHVNPQAGFGLRLSVCQDDSGLWKDLLST